MAPSHWVYALWTYDTLLGYYGYFQTNSVYLVIHVVERHSGLQAINGVRLTFDRLLDGKSATRTCGDILIFGGCI
jgi:hypothetical protein